MGAWLVVEALRQLKLSRHGDALRRINQVVLAAPDIDIDLFKRQIETIGPLAHPIIVLNSTDDRALAISRRIGGFRVRMGSIGEDSAVVQEMIAKKAIRVIDLSVLPAPDGANHNRFIKLAEILSRSERRRKTLLENGLDGALVHDSKKWQPVFRQDHAQIIR
jgi:esterase/lipase superfamily enzyme